MSKPDKHVLYHLPKLRGKNLACWCKPDAPCHADVLLELASGGADSSGNPLRRPGVLR